MDVYRNSTTEQKERDRWATPPAWFAAIQKALGLAVVFDVCAEHATSKCGAARCWTIDDDALARDWRDELRRLSPLPVAFMNPPYSDPAPWVAKAAEEAGKGMFVIGLLPDTRDRAWWKVHIEGVAPLVLVPDRRIQFQKPDGTPSRGNFQGSAVPLWTPWRTGMTVYPRFDIEGRVWLGNIEHRRAAG